MGFEGLSIAISGLDANQRSLEVTAHNIANADNPDYVRQRAIQQDSYYSTLGVTPNGIMQMGTGVGSQSVTQIRDQLLDIKYRKEVVKYGYYSGMQSTYETMSALFNEISNNGLQSATDSFWSKWQEVQKDPQSLTNRALLKDSAIAYAESVNELASGLNKFRKDTDTAIVSKTNEINNAAKIVAQMNGEIRKNEGGGQNANDYMDTRNKYIDVLAKDLGVQVTNNLDGTVNVLVNGAALVQNTDYDQIDVQKYTGADGDKAGYSKLVWHKTGQEFAPTPESGEFRSLLDTRDTVIVDYKNRLNTMVQKIAKDINSIHKNGYGITKDASGKPVTGELFFIGDNANDDSDISADNIRFNPDLQDTNKIAASKSGDVSDSDIAMDIINLRNTNGYIFKDISGSSLTVSGTSPVDLTDKNSFDIYVNDKKYTISIPDTTGAYSGTYTYSNATDLNTALGKAITNAKDENGNTVDLSSSVKFSYDSTTNSVNLKLVDDSTNVLYVEDKQGCLSAMNVLPGTKYDDFYNSMILGMGQGGEEAKTIAKSQESVITEVDNRRKAMSGVSQEEEMANMLQFQHAYDASARVVNAIDEMMDIIINKL